MYKHKLALFFGLLCICLVIIGIKYIASGHTAQPQVETSASQPQPTVTSGIISGSFDKSKFKSDAEWHKILTPEQFNILRQAGTEIPFTGKLEYENRKGTYYSAGCNEPVFRSETKYDSGTGWPSFYAPISKDALVLREDNSLGKKRIEVLDKCGGHLGHIFDDGPQPTGKRYCMNSAALYFIPDKEQ